MKKIYGILFLLALMAFKTNLQAQTPCEHVTVTLIQPSPQSGDTYYYGAKVSIEQAYSEDITVFGKIYDINSPSPSYMWSLTIEAGQLSAQTSTSHTALSSSVDAGIAITSVTNCPLTADVSTQVQDYITASNFIITKIAASSLTSTQISSISNDNDLINAGIFTSNEVDSLNTVIQTAKSGIVQNLNITGAETCENCSPSYSTKAAKIASLVTLLRNDSTSYQSSNTSFDNGLIEASRYAPVANELETAPGPNCKFKFYICLAICSGSSSGLMAAACVWLCACEYCQVKPPGCNW